MGYSTDLTNKQWELIEHIFRAHKGQHFVEHPKRILVNAVLYIVKTGCQQRLLPNDFPPWETVWSFYRRAVKSGKWEKAMDILVQKTRKNSKCKASAKLCDYRLSKRQNHILIRRQGD